MEERLVDKKEALSEGESSSLFSDPQISRLDRRFKKRPDRESAQFGSRPLSAESPATILSPSWTSDCTSCRTSCQVQAAHQHLVALRFSQPLLLLLDDITFLALLAGWKSKGRLPFGNASLTESLSASDPWPPLTLFELAI